MAETNAHNEFEALRRDFHPSKVPPRYYNYARNAVRISKKYGGISNGVDHFVGITRERSTIKYAKFPGEVVGYTYLEERDWAIFFVRSGGSSEIGYVDLSKKKQAQYTTIIRDTDLGCKWGFGECEWKYAEFKTMQPCGEIHMYWSSNCYYYVANIDECLDPARKGLLKCDDFLLFKCVSGPTVSALASENGGAGLLAGSYQFVVRLRDKDGNTTNFFNFSSPVSVSGENNKAGEITNQSIKVHIEQLDTRYNQVELYVVKTVNGQTTAEHVTTRHYNSNGITVTYNGSRPGTDANILELLTKKRKWIRGQDLIQKDNTLWLYKIRQEKNPNVQAWAWQAQVGFAVYKCRPEDAHKYMQFRRGEVYALGLSYHACDGTDFATAHLSPINGGGNYEQALSEAQKYADERLKVLPKVEPYVAEEDKLPDGLETRFSGSGEGGATSSGAGDVDGYQWEDEDEIVGFEKDLLNNLSDNIGQTNSSNSTSNCVDCDQEAAKQSYEVGESSNADFGDFASDGIENNLPKDPAKNTSNSLTDALTNFINKLLNKKYKKRKKTNYQNQRSPLAGSSGQDADLSTETVGTRGATGTYKNTSEEIRQQQKELVKVGEYPALPWQSEETYPTTRDCSGNYIYGGAAGQPIVHFQVPWDIPLVESAQKGVVNHYQMDNYETNDTWYYFVGLSIKNVYLPTSDELGKPLSKTRPWDVVMMPRDDVNKSILGQALAIQTFTGDIQGVSHAVPKNGVNSRDYVDVHIGTRENHIGSDGSNQFCLYGPDFHYLRPPMITNELYHMWDVRGSGFRHNLYAKGRDTDDVYKDRIDQRAACQAVNLNQYSSGGGKIKVDGAGYAPGNKTVKAPKGVDKPLCNMYRESCVYIQSGIGSYNDNSFVMDGLNHERHLPDAHAAVVNLLKPNPAQYGRLESARYVQTGLYGLGSATQAEALVGDSFIGMWSIIRKAYISNLIGNEPLDPPQHIYTALQKLFALDDCTRLPNSGDRDDKKNEANGYPGQAFPNAGGASQSVYYPKVLNSLDHVVLETDVNIHKLELGDPKQGEVYYQNRKGLYIGSDVPKGTPWEESLLNQFYCEVRRPSKWKRLKAALTRSLNFAGPVALMAGGGWSIESTFDPLHSLGRALAALGLYLVMDKGVFSQRTVKRFFDIPICETDDEGGMDYDSCIRNWHDIPRNYCGDFSNHVRVGNYIGIPDPYNTCSCNECHPLVHTQEILFSNPQSPESQLDSYKSFEANSYVGMRVDLGRIQKMFILGKTLYVQTTDNICEVPYARNDTILTEQQIGLYTPWIVAEPRPILEGLDEGIYGTLDANAGINTPLGRFFPDADARAIYNFGGGDIKEITSGLGREIQQKFDFCSEYSCRDEKSNKGVGYVFGYDPALNRLLVTKQDGANSFTLSFDPARQEWVSFHDYVPQFYVWNRKRMFSVKNNALWLHNEGDGFGNFYGQQGDFELDFSANNSNIGTFFKTKSLKLFTEANKGNVRRLAKTFNKLAVYNTNQSTGWLTLTPQEQDQGDMSKRIEDDGNMVEIRRMQTYWSVNKFKDYHHDKNIPVLDIDDCKVYEGINASQDYEGTRLDIEDNYVNVRLKLEGESDLELNVFAVEVLKSDPNELQK